MFPIKTIVPKSPQLGLQLLPELSSSDSRSQCWRQHLVCKKIINWSKIAYRQQTCKKKFYTRFNNVGMIFSKVKYNCEKCWTILKLQEMEIILINALIYIYYFNFIFKNLYAFSNYSKIFKFVSVVYFVACKFLV